MILGNLVWLCWPGSVSPHTGMAPTFHFNIFHILLILRQEAVQTSLGTVGEQQRSYHSDSCSCFKNLVGYCEHSSEHFLKPFPLRCKRKSQQSIIILPASSSLLTYPSHGQALPYARRSFISQAEYEKLCLWLPKYVIIWCHVYMHLDGIRFPCTNRLAGFSPKPWWVCRCFWVYVPSIVRDNDEQHFLKI